MAGILLFIPYVFIPGILILLAAGSFLGWRSFRKKYIGTSQFESRWHFAFRVLGISQIVVFLLLVAFLVGTFGFGLFIAPIIVFANVLAAIVIFIFSALIYPRAIKWATETAKVQQREPISSLFGNFSAFAYAIAGVLIPTILFIGLNGMELPREFFAEFILATGNVSLVKMYPDEYKQQNLYAKIAAKKQDPSICDNLVPPLLKSNCYQVADPEFPQYLKTCDLYMKQGDAEQADYIQQNCLINKMYTEKKSSVSGDALNCDLLQMKYANNRRMGYILEECQRIKAFKPAQ